MPKVTVLIAVYNGDRYISEIIEGILSQTFQNWEFLIINDGSSDHTRKIILSYGDPRIRLVDNDYNLGLSRSLNKGLKLAEGELIAPQDADDISEPERLAKQVAFLETHPEIALLGTWYKEIDAEGNLIGNRELPCECTQIRWDILFYCPFVHSAIMLRKSIVLEQIGFYDETFTYAEDYNFFSRIAHCLPVANLNGYLMKLRINPSSMTATYGNIITENTQQIMISNIRHLHGLAKTKMLREEVQLRIMTSLMIGSTDEFNIQSVNISVIEIFHLHAAFCHYYKIELADCWKFHVQICTRMSYQLIKLAHCSFEKYHYTVWQLLVQAYSLHLPILLTKKHASLVLNLLIGPCLVKGIKFLTQS